jgi:hypothetical protein
MPRNKTVQILSLSLMFALATVIRGHASNRVALVIGNGAYHMSPLKNPVNDADDVSDALQKLGFNVTKIIDADRRKMTMAIHEFGQALKKDMVGLFYYAGHGLQLDGINYLLPVDALIHSELDIPFESVSANRVLAHMESAENRLNIVIFDACRNNPYERSFRQSKHGLAHMDPPRGSLVVFATGPNNVAVDGNGRNGTFTKNFLKYISHPDLELGLMMRKIRADVEAETDGLQSPYEVSNVKGTFYFSKDAHRIDSRPEQIPLVAALPPEVKGIKDFDAKLRVIERWKAWQAKMAQDFQKAQGYDQSILSADEKMAAWQSFLEAYAADNPYSDEDHPMRKTARTRLAHWKRSKSRISSSKEEKNTLPSPAAHEPREDTPIERFDELGNGIILDAGTNLQWYLGPNRNMTWQEARKWVKQLRIDGGRWRLPTVKELTALHPNNDLKGPHSPFLESGKWRVWSGEKLASGSVGGFNFEGGHEFWGFPDRDRDKRVFAVRSEAPSKALPEPETHAYVEIGPAVPRTKDAGIGKRSRFEELAGGVVMDKVTGLEWKAGPDKDTTWAAAQKWLATLNANGGSWRMPKLMELVDLYEEGSGTRNMTPFLKTSGWLVWAERNPYASPAWDFYYNRGDWFRFPHDLSDRFRVFAVRPHATSSARSSSPKPSLAALSKNLMPADIAAVEGDHQRSRNGIVYDRRTGLEWFVGPETDVTWHEARRWAESLAIGGGRWRLPTVDELTGLHEKRQGGASMPSMIATKGTFIWSAEVRGASSAWGFSSGFFGKGWFGKGWRVRPHEDARGARVFAVRSQR